MPDTMIAFLIIFLLVFAMVLIYILRITKKINEIERLWDLCEAEDFGFENWTSSIHMLCKQCSEGTPHESHDEDLEEKNFDQEINLAIAAKTKKELDEVLLKWTDDFDVVVTWVEP